VLLLQQLNKMMMMMTMTTTLEALMSCAGRGEVARVSSTAKLITSRPVRYFLTRISSVLAVFSIIRWSRLIKSTYYLDLLDR